MWKDPQRNLSLPVTSLALLVVLAVLLLGGHDERETPSISVPLAEPGGTTQAFLPVTEGQDIFQGESFRDLKALVTNPNPFATSFFIPPQPQTPAPSPPAATQKITVSYAGSYVFGEGERKGFLRVDGKLVTAGEGLQLQGGIVVSSITAERIELTLPDGKKESVPFRGEVVLEIPR